MAMTAARHRILWAWRFLCWGLWTISIVEAFQSATDGHRLHRRYFEKVSPPATLSRNTVSLLFRRHHRSYYSTQIIHRHMMMSPASQVSQAEAQKGIDKVVEALRRDKTANTELGRLEKVTIVLGYGSPAPGDQLLLRFNASFKKSGKGLSAVPLPFMLGQSDEPAGRGNMVGQVKAAIDTQTGKVVSCTVFRDLGYGRAFNLKV